ncbi:hypothetical protein DH2020_034228 [Rehmannia glutinosa]|uniref:Uncharacterized protein n=1 Tax=Rehmannia glutinosa TaxID=99300 RepID=A0ABR0V9V6_REHGL
MAEAEKEEAAKKVIEQIGKQLAASKTCPNKTTLVKLLKQATSAFPELKQSESLKFSVKPLSDSLIKHGLLDHKDRDVRLLVGISLCEVIRVLAPNPDFSIAVSRDIFRFLLSMFGELDDIASPYFSRRAKLLETVAKLRFCLVMLDTGCEDLVLKMFKSFFSVVREDHPQSLINSMSSIITSILEEKTDADPDSLERNTSQSLLDVILQNIIKVRKPVASASSRLAASVIQNYGKCWSATDQVDVRIKALNLIRKLLALHGQHVARDYPHVFIELLNRFSDKSAEVRLAALSCAKPLYMTNQSGRESIEILSAIQDRLLDHDDKVRVEAVNVVLVRSKALKKLVELYQEYCTRCAAGITLLNEHIEEIPCKVLMLCYEKDCQEFRPQSMELVLADLFPASLSIEERTRHWIFIFSLFKPPHLKALKIILSQKRRLQDGLKDYLDLWNGVENSLEKLELHSPNTNDQAQGKEFVVISFCWLDINGSRDVNIIVLVDNGSEKAKKKMEALVVKMSSCFPDSAKAKDCFQRLKNFKDNETFNVLQRLLRNQTTLDTETTEKQFQLWLLEREIPFNEQLIEMLAREGYHMSIKLSDIYPSLEKVCLEGTRAQSKHAVSAIAALAGTSEQSIFSKLCKALTSKDLDMFDESSNCCSSCKLKVFGLKALVRSFLPHTHACLIRPISFLLDIIQQMLQKCGFSAGSIPCEHDEAFIRLAAAKSVLRLSRRWDLHISPQIFRFNDINGQGSFFWGTRSFTSKLHKLLINHTVPSRYACAFSFVVLDSLEDLRSDALKYLEAFIREYGKGTTTMQESANHPVYIVVFLIHVLAHDPNFPAPDCRDEKIYAEFLSPLFVIVQALVNEMLVDGNLRLKYNASLYLRSIFNAIKRAEDAVDAQMTPKLHLLAAVGISILDSLNINNTPVPHTPGLVLLPSSLYKSGPPEMKEAGYCLPVDWL